MLLPLALFFSPSLSPSVTHTTPHYVPLHPFYTKEDGRKKEGKHRYHSRKTSVHTLLHITIAHRNPIRIHRLGIRDRRAVVMLVIAAPYDCGLQIYKCGAVDGEGARGVA